MKRYVFALMIGSLGLGTASAQKAWGLRECCEYAVEHNIGIKQQQNQCRQQEIQLSTAKNSRLPTALIHTQGMMVLRPMYSVMSSFV